MVACVFVLSGNRRTDFRVSRHERLLRESARPVRINALDCLLDERYVHDVIDLPRAWPTAGPRDDLWGGKGSYSLVPYEALPPIPSHASFDWLGVPPPGVVVTGDETKRGQIERLIALAEREGLRLPSAFIDFFRSPVLRRRVPTCTSCYFDLADRFVLLPDGSRLLRFLNDQQASYLWYLRFGVNCCDVVFAWPEWLDREGAQLDDTLQPRDVTICAPSFEEFIYRFWIENAIWFALWKGRPLTPTEQAYVAAIRATKTQAATKRDQ